MREAGSAIGPYRVVSLIGRGGMGEVYRAHDPRLLRDVAVKVLRQEMAADHEFLSRFEREAQSASALNHPNIVTVYGVGQEGTAPYIAMELVEGRTLREVLSEGRLPTRKLTEIARQIVDGLATAHGRGIVHRDLKPENVIVSREGGVKILDFGLAKATATSEATSHDSTQNVTPPGTGPGTVLGTLAYMSPEQASGTPADFRSDQFSFGAMLYEMAAGQPAFRRKTAAQTLGAILRDEPEPLPPLEPSIDAPMRWILERTLAKDPEDRYASTRDLLQDVSNLRHELSRPLSSMPGRAAARPSPYATGAIAAAVALAAGLWGGQHFLRPQPLAFKPLTFARGTIWSGRFGADGRSVVYSAAWEGRPFRIFRKSPESEESLPVAAPAAEVLAVSGQGEIAALVDLHVAVPGRNVGVLARISPAGGAPRKLLEDVAYADWAPNGQDMAVVHTVAGRSVLEYPQGTARYTSSGWISHPRVSRDGKRVAFLDHPIVGDDRGEVKVLESTVATWSQGWGAVQGLAWSPGEGEVWVSGSQAAGPCSGLPAVYAVRPGAELRAVARTAGSLMLLDVSSDGQVLVARQDRRLGISLRLGDGRERDLSFLGSSFPADLSADGSMMLFTEFGEAGGPAYGTYLGKTDGSPATRLGDGFAKALSSDLAWALVLQPEPLPRLILLPTGAGQARPVPVPFEHFHQVGLLPKGRRIVIAGNQTGEGTRLFVQDLAGGAPRAISPDEIVAGVPLLPVSNDEKWVAAMASDQQLHLYPIEGGEARALGAGTTGLVPVRLAEHAGRLYLFAARLDRVPTQVEKIDVADGASVTWATIAPADPAGIHGFPAVHLSADGKTLAYSYARFLSELYLVTGAR